MVGAHGGAHGKCSWQVLMVGTHVKCHDRCSW